MPASSDLTLLDASLEREIFRSYIQRTDKVVVILTPTLKIRTANNYGRSILGLEENFKSGIDFIATYVPSSLAPEVVADYETLLNQAGTTPVKNEFQLQLQNAVSNDYSWQHFAVRDNSGEVSAILSVGEDVSQERQTEAVLKRRDATLEAFSRAAHHFLLAVPEYWEENVLEVLELVGKARGSDRVYLCKNTPLENGDTGLYLRYEWKATGERFNFLPDGQIKTYPAAGLTRWAEKLSAQEALWEEIAALPSGEKQWNIAPQAKSLVVVPVFVGNDWWGYFGFEDWEEVYPYALPELEALKAVAAAFGAAIKRKRIEEELSSEKLGVEKKIEERTQELKLAQQEIKEGLLRIRQEKARLTASIHSLSLGFLLTELNGQVVLYNHAVNDILGESPEGWSLEILTGRLGDNLDLKKTLALCLKNRREMVVEDVTYQDKFLRFLFTPIKMIEDDGRVIGAVILIEDATQAKMLQKSRDEFFAVASHELRTPLTAIKGNSLMILKLFSQSITDPQVTEMLQDILDSSERLIAIVNENLDVSRLEMDKINPVMEPFDLLQTIHQVMEELKGSAASKNLAWEFTPPSDNSTMVLADTGRTKQILVNLLGNALKYTQSGGIKVLIDHQPGKVLVKVSDSGEGIPTEDQTHLFEKFKMAGDRIYQRSDSESTGMGLYISRLLAQAMGGSVYLESSAAGQGSTFVLALNQAA